MAFHDVRLPDDVERGASGGPEFHTTIIPLSSGGEQANVDWEEARQSWDLSYGMQDDTDFKAVRAFFYARRGMANYFRFKDWSDYEREGELQGVGDGANKTFQLISVYERDGPDPYVRRITRPVLSTVVWLVDDVVRGATHNGLGSFTLSGAAPADGALITANFEFDWAARFNIDKFGLTLQQFNAGEIPQIPIIEVRE